MLSQLLFSYCVSPWRSQIAKTSLLCMGSNQLQTRAYPLMKYVPDQPDRTAEQLSYESLKKRGGVSKGNKWKNERNKNELANSYDMLTRGQSVPKRFHSHSFSSIQTIPQLFSFSYVQHVCQKGSTQGQSLKSHHKPCTCRRRWSNIWNLQRGVIFKPLQVRVVPQKMSLSAPTKHKRHSVYQAADGGVIDSPLIDCHLDSWVVQSLVSQITVGDQCLTGS